MCTKKEVHIFNVWTIIMPSLNIKEWKLFELQIIQNRHPLSILDGKNIRVQHPAKMSKYFWNVWSQIKTNFGRSYSYL